MRHTLGVLIINFVVVTSVFAESRKVGIDPADVSRSTPDADNGFLVMPGMTKALGWTKTCNGDNLCGGCYSESDNMVNNPNPAAFGDTPMNVMASQPAFFTQAGTTVLRGDVKLIQPGREITADHVTFFRDNNTGKIHKSILVGHVNFRESGKLIVAEQGNLDFANKIYILHRGIYRLLANTPTGLSNVWGRATHAINSVAGVLKLKQATYTSCQPGDPAWYLRGNEIELNRNTGRGDVTHAFIYFKKVPVFYAPYFNFPIDKRRKSGFLTPIPTYSSDSGFGIDIPYYFNLAPNYDATFSPQIFTNRGVLFGGVFRYLTITSNGSVNFGYIPYDTAFIKFRDSAVAPGSRVYDYHALKSLKESKNSRGILNLQQDSHFGENWKAALIVNYATDDYFLQDFGHVATIVDNDQLLNRADISYSDYHWGFLGRLQAFQTLHPITHQWVEEQYKRLPQINFSGDFPGGWLGLDYGFDSEIVNFIHRDDYEGTIPVPASSGSRFNIAPSLGAPLNWLGGYIMPRVQLQTTGYNIHDKVGEIKPNNIVRVTPLVSIDSGVVFRRDINFLHKGYTQTLEPRVFYLYVPKREQEDIPLFDTYLPAFDFNQLFRVNRFSGIDRIGDANQIAVGITTRFLDEYGQEKFNAGIGQIAAIHKHQVDDKGKYGCDPLNDEYFSPLVGKLQYFIYPKVNATVNTAWDPSYQRLNTLETNLQYVDSSDHVVNLWYRYVIHGDQDPSRQAIDLSRIGFSVGWKVWQHWNIIGNLNYNASCKRMQNYLYGLEYNSCCWAMRVAHSRNFIGVGMDKKNYESRVYFQFVLKGVGNNMDFGGLEGVLANQIAGYRSKLQ